MSNNNEIKKHIKMTKQIFMMSSFVLILASCGTTEIDPIVEKLKLENDSLKTEIKRMEHSPEYCKVIPYPTFENLKVKLGDTATLNIGLLRTIEINPPTVVLWNEMTNSYSDTIADVSSLGISTRKFLAKSKGTHTIKGEIFYFCNERKTSSLFESSYIVE